eukprot:TRINITY_DN77523_c0_g1_i1.p1 TRINITY_DN77523_c0_g1~~TRINITY_DN77523_c0_g1_i1.p1  ORF type:complete len:136 (-),score=30.55 TRINITY_DN77523_c0_g1_i1:10-417(-)
MIREHHPPIETMPDPLMEGFGRRSLDTSGRRSRERTETDELFQELEDLKASVDDDKDEIESNTTGSLTTPLGAFDEGVLTKDLFSRHDAITKEVMGLQNQPGGTNVALGLEVPDPEIGRAVQQECRDRSRMPSSA